MGRRDTWKPVLDAELKRWTAKSCEELIADLEDMQVYQVQVDSIEYQFEVEMLENTAEYVHVMVAVDDGSLPASISPLTHTFIRQKHQGSQSDSPKPPARHLRRTLRLIRRYAPHYYAVSSRMGGCKLS